MSSYNATATGRKMKIIDTIKSLPRSSKLRLGWDIFMVWVVLINLWLIVFDLTYLWLRPTYFQYIPVVTRLYDPVKGITPDALTTDLIETIETTREIVQRDPYAPELPGQVKELRSMTVQLFLDDPFSESGQGNLLQVIRQNIAAATGFEATELTNPKTLVQALERLFPLDPERMELRFEETLAPDVRRALELCYDRSYDRSGHLTDKFWIIDLPFLILFWIEFLVRWYLALKRKTYDKWFFFPIFNWYDVLGLIPSRYFRIFRLFRAVSMYMRLRRSELSVVGQDIISRTVAYISNIITEEVSDRVALRILGEFAEEIADGTHNRIARETVEPRRTEIESVITSQIRQTLTNPEALANLRTLLLLNLENAVDESESLHSVPMPNFVLNPLVRTIGEIIIDTTFETVETTFASEEGQEALEGVATAVFDDIFYGPGLAEIEALVKDITLQVIEHMTEVVAIKKWTLPDGSATGWDLDADADQSPSLETGDNDVENQ